MADRTCIDCAGPVSRHSQTGRCRICALRAANRDPELIAKRTEGNRRRYQDPEVRARHAEACRQAKLRLMQDPAALERMREAGRIVGTKNFWHANTPAAREAAKLAIKRRALSWCPEEFWDLNRQLKWKGLLLPERKRVILELVPETPEHGRRLVDNEILKQRLREERRQREAY